MNRSDSDDQLYLASASPRRRQLLEAMGLRFKVVITDVEENTPVSASAQAVVSGLAQEKARRGQVLAQDYGWPTRPVLGADTLVVVDDEMLGKPRDRADGLRMLKLLSGRSHQVLTAIAVYADGQMHHSVSASTVHFADLSQREIERYWDSNEPRDKAGAYAIQGWGAGFITRLDGSFSGVVGLPLYELRNLLTKIGIDWL